MDVAIQDLTQHLLTYLGEVQAGRELVVTDRGRPIARIVPVSGEGVLQRGIDDGWIRPACRNGPVGGSARHRPSGHTSDVVDDDRG